MRITRRKFLAALGSGVVATGGSACYGRFIEPERFEVTHKRIDIARYANGTNATIIRVLHLSDFHASPSVSLPFIESAIDAGLSQNPDLICLTGDFITTTLENESAYAAILGKLPAQAPTFASPGNHDGGLWAGRYGGGYRNIDRVRALLAGAKIDFLVNARRDLRLRGREVTLAGLGDLWAGQLGPEGVLDRARAGAISSRPVIVLSHDPDSKSVVADYAWDLMLCGHTHGGQIRIPFTNFRPFLPVQDKTMDEGLHAWSDRQINITRGVGNLHGVRFNCPPEVTVLDLAV